MSQYWEVLFMLFWGFAGFVNGWQWRGHSEAVKRDREADERHREFMRSINE